MKLSKSISAVACAAALAFAAPAMAQTAHQGHEQKAQPAEKSGHKMMIPAMDEMHFVQMMKKHHQDGIEMAKIEESRGTRENVKTLAAKIREGQERELAELESHGGDHAKSGDKATAGDHAKHDTAAKPQGTAGADTHDASMQKHHEMMEKMAQESKAKLENASGDAVDHAFVHEMAMHHEMALQMIAKTTFKDPELRKLSQKMAAGQKRELGELKALQKTMR